VKDKYYDLIVIGAGVAGLATAEIFSRSGQKVLLIEKNEKICQEASGMHHGWFHFGSLYSIFPNNQFLKTLVGGVDDLLEFYSDLPGMNIKINSKNKLDFLDSKGQWFRNESIEYIVSARNNSDFSLNKFDGFLKYLKKLFFVSIWELAIKQFVSRHQRFYKFKWGVMPASSWIPKAGWADYSRDIISKPEKLDANLDKDTHFRIVGFDRPMISTNIVSDLLKSFLSNGGILKTNSKVDSVKRKEGRVVVGDETYTGKRVIIASGHHTNDLLKDEERSKILISPLIVAYPSVSRTNFVRLTPFVEKSVNHIFHEIDGKKYSVIGGGFFADPNNQNEIRQAEKSLMEMAKKVFPKLSGSKHEVYFSHKTESIPKSGERNYQYNINDLNDGLYEILPGKFSLGFSLAVNIYKEITGKIPEKKCKINQQISIEGFIEPMKHGKIVSDFVK